MMAEEDKRARSRAMFPQCVAFAEKMREQFGPDVRMTYAREGENVAGKPDPGPFADCTPLTLLDTTRKRQP